MASGKKPCARRDALRSCPHSGDRAAAAGCPRALKPRALRAEVPHPFCGSGPAGRGVDQGTRFYRSRPVRRGQHRYCRGRTVCRRRGRRTWTALPCIPLADLPDASSLRFRSGRPARRSGPVCGSMQGWSAGRQAGRGVNRRSAMSGLHGRS